MTSRTNDPHQDPTRQVFDALRTAPEPLRRSAREAIEDGNLETFMSLVSEFLGTPAPAQTEPQFAPAVLNRVDWDWLAGEFLDDSLPPDTKAPPPGTAR
jgi:hypothetical protein